MEFTNRFHVPLALADAWKLMLDVPRILPCLPGARLVDVLGPNKYKGSVSVKLGPVKLAFEGEAELVRVDEQAHVAWLKGSGMDAKGRGAAQSEFSFSLKESAGGTDVTVHTQLQLTGAIAQYGRGSGMISEVAAQILAQFEQNLSDMLLDEGDQAPAPQAPASQALAPAASVAAAGVPPEAVMPAAIAGAQPSASASPAPQEMQALYYQSQALLAQSQSVLAATQQALAEVRAVARMARRPGGAKELNAFSLMWRALWASLTGRSGSGSQAPKG